MKPAFAVAALLASLVIACGGGRTREVPAPSTSPSGAPVGPTAPMMEAASATGDGASLDAGSTTNEAPDAASSASAKPPPVERTGKTWPFHAWDRAEAFTYNRFPMRPGAPFRIYDDNGWSKHVVDKKPLDAALTKQAVDLVLAGKSELEMTKCPFPRHAVVLYDHDVPVASINVCFSCGDVLLSPRWAPPEVESRREKLFAQVFPKWKTFFRDAVGYPVDEQWR